MSLIYELSTPKRPEYAETLRQFPLACVAEKVGVSYSYLSNILSGQRKPGGPLERKLKVLARQVKSELAELERA